MIADQISQNNRSLKQILDFHSSGNLQAALQGYEQLVQEFPCEDLTLLLGLVHHELGNSSVGQSLISQRASTNIVRSDLFYELGQSLLQRNQVHLAIAALEHSLGISPKNLLALSSYYRASHQLGLLQHEITDLFCDFDSSVGRIQFKMYYFRGKDQVVNCAKQGGLNAYEPPFALILVNCIREFPGVFLDIGANTGFFSLLAVAAGVHSVISFEPLKPIFDLLGCNTELNRFSESILLEELAISDFNGTMKLHIPIDNHNLLETSASLESTFKENHSKAVTVNTSTLDSYISQKYSGLERISLLKIDIEGHEPSALSGSLETIKKHRPIIFVEILTRSDFAFFSSFISDNSYAEVVAFSEEAILPDTVKFYPNQPNHILVPQEILHEKFLPMLIALGIRVVDRVID